MNGAPALRTVGAGVRSTLSGARILPICPDAYADSLTPFGDEAVAVRDAIVVWGAFEDDGALIGVGHLRGAVRPSTQAGVMVAPDRRRLGIAKELVQALIHDAALRGFSSLVRTHAPDDLCPLRLAESLGLLVARRIGRFDAATCIWLPPPDFSR